MDEESSDSNSESESLCLQGQTKKRKRSKHVQSFVDEWLTDKQFKEWLSKRVGKESKPQPYCKYCQKFVTCTKTGLKRHSTSNIHQKNTKDTSVARTLTSYFLARKFSAKKGNSQGVEGILVLQLWKHCLHRFYLIARKRETILIKHGSIKHKYVLIGGFSNFQNLFFTHIIEC